MIQDWGAALSGCAILIGMFVGGFFFLVWAKEQLGIPVIISGLILIVVFLPIGMIYTNLSYKAIESKEDK